MWAWTGGEVSVTQALQPYYFIRPAKVYTTLYNSYSPLLVNSDDHLLFRAVLIGDFVLS